MEKLSLFQLHKTYIKGKLLFCVRVYIRSSDIWVVIGVGTFTGVYILQHIDCKVQIKQTKFIKFIFNFRVVVPANIWE